MGVWTKESKSGVALPIAFDNVTSPSNVNAGSLTYAHTINTSSFTLLFVGVTKSQSQSISSVTYAGVGMTKIGSSVNVPGDTRDVNLYFLFNPAGGTNNVVITLSGTGSIFSEAASYVNTASSQPDNNTSNTLNSNGTLTTTLTPVVSNCWAVVYGYQTSTSLTAGTGSTYRGGGQSAIFDSNAIISGSTAMSVTVNGAFNGGATIMASFAPNTNTVVFTKQTKNVGTFTKETKS